MNLEPENVHTYNSLGNSYIELELYDAAIAAFRAAIDLDPLYAPAYNGLGHIYFVLDRYDEAVAAFERATDLEPELALAHQNLGYMYTDLERYDEGIRAFRRAITLEPNNARPYHGLGLLYAILSHYDEAIMAFQHAIRLDPKYAGPRISLAGICRKLGRESDYTEQVNLVHESIRQEKPYTRARFAAICGHVDEALILLAQALAKAPGYRRTARRAADFDAIHKDPRFEMLTQQDDKSI